MMPEVGQLASGITCAKRFVQHVLQQDSANGCGQMFNDEAA
jgi:hypothetical protein